MNQNLMTYLKRGTVLVGLLVAFTSLKAQDKLSANVSADFRSAYLWRGEKLGNISIQPNLEIGYRNFFFNAWGSVGTDKDDTKEIDLSIGYQYNNITFAVVDYWTDQYTDDNGRVIPKKFFNHLSANHVLGAEITCDFEAFSIYWSTNFAGADGVTRNGNRAYSSYLSLAVPFTIENINFTAEVGAVPWGSDYYEGAPTRFAVNNINLKAEKEIKITNQYSLPIYAQVVFNPYTENAFFAFGFTLD